MSITNFHFTPAEVQGLAEKVAEIVSRSSRIREVLRLREVGDDPKRFVLVGARDWTIWARFDGRGLMVLKPEIRQALLADSEDWGHFFADYSLTSHGGPEEFLVIDQAAAFLGYRNAQTLRTIISRHRGTPSAIPCLKLPTGAVRFKKSELQDWALAMRRAEVAAKDAGELTLDQDHDRAIYGEGGVID